MNIQIYNLKKSEVVVINNMNLANLEYFEEYPLDNKKIEEFRTRVEQTAYNLLKEQLPYEDLCWELAEFQLLYEKGRGKYNKRELRNKSKRINEVSPSYRQICWIIATYKVWLTEKKLYP